MTRPIVISARTLLNDEGDFDQIFICLSVREVIKSVMKIAIREELGWNIEKPYTQKQIGKAGPT